MKDKALENLLNKYVSGNCSPAERNAVESYLDSYDNGNQFWENLSPSDQLEWQYKLRLETEQRIFSADKSTSRITSLMHFWLPVAAAITIIIGVTFYFNYTPKRNNGVVYTNDVRPGRYKAILKLPSGKEIPLNETNGGIVFNNGRLSYRDGATVLSGNNGSDQDAIDGQITIETPVGCTYSVILPDGSKVWLNAASTLSFNSSLGSLNARTVSLLGEGYFEVVHHAHKPFRVNTSKQQVEVLGTHFNVNSYYRDGYEKVTLLQGSVRVRKRTGEKTIEQSTPGYLLKPKQQLILGSKGTAIVSVNGEEATAWKEGLFIFSSNTNIKTFMPEIERWYKVKVRYKGDMSEVNFTGSVSRFKKLSVLLEKLALTGQVSFEIDKDIVTVIRK